MRILNLQMLVVLVLLVSCGKKNTLENSEDVKTKITGRWTMLTSDGGELVRYEPCDAANTTLEIKNDTLVIAWGHDADIFKIESIVNSKGKYVLNTRPDKINTEKKSYTFELLPDGMTKWWLWEYPGIFVDEAHAENFKTTQEPCAECWPPEECEEMASDGDKHYDFGYLVGKYELEGSNGLQFLMIKAVAHNEFEFSIENISETDCKGALEGTSVINDDMQSVFQIDGCSLEFIVAEEKIEIAEGICDAKNPACNYSGVYSKTEGVSL